MYHAGAGRETMLGVDGAEGVVVASDVDAAVEAVAEAVTVGDEIAHLGVASGDGQG